MKRTLLFLLLIHSVLQAQSFSTWSGRNHPQIEWITAETDHFRIIYPAHLAGIEAEAAPIAEQSYASLSRLLGVEFDYKIPIYLSDQDEIVNGFAVPFDRSYTQIWVRLNEMTLFTGQEKWLRKVLAHELAHIFHFRAVRSNAGLFGMLPALPRQWTEGFAQYSTEKWDAVRGDALLRTAIFEDRPSYNRGESIKDGGLTYAVGNSQLRYFTYIHGDSAVGKLFAHRDTLFNRIRYHNFDKAFKHVTGEPYRAFDADWRRFANIHYNTLAGYMGHLDSLKTKPLILPGTFLTDVRYSPDTTRIAVSGYVSDDLPFFRIWIVENRTDSTKKGKPKPRKNRVIYEGPDAGQLAWSADGSTLLHSRTRRGPNGSLIPDIFAVDVSTGRSRRVTTNLRATFPIWSNDGSAIYAAVNTGGTGNIHRIDPVTGRSTPMTAYTGDVQVSFLRMHPTGPWLAFSRFNADGGREIVILNVDTGEESAHTDPFNDDRNPVWSPDGSWLAYTSLRDLVPNVFAAPFDNGRMGEEVRITNQFTGFTAWQWLPSDSARTDGQLVGRATDSKMRDQAWRIDAGKRTELRTPVQVPYFTEWTTRIRDDMIPWVIAPDASLIRSRGRYAPAREIDHVVSLPWAYYNTATDWGIGGFTYWREPLGIHELNAGASIAPLSMERNSLVSIGYVNRRFAPTLTLEAYHNLFESRVYSDNLLVNATSGVRAGAILPLDLFDHPFATSDILVRSGLRWSRPNADSFTLPLQDNLPTPIDGIVGQLDAALTLRRQKPNRGAFNHMLDGMGLRLAARSSFMDADHIQTDAAAYALVPIVGPARLYLFGRAVNRIGSGLPQDIVGLNRYDTPELGDLGIIQFERGGTERVRGYRKYVVGDALYFGTAEVRVPVVGDLQTQVLGLVSLGRTSVSAFADVGMVTGVSNLPGVDTEKRAGIGFEARNEVRILGLSISQSVGLARPADRWDDAGANDLYWRIKGVVAF